MKNKFNFLTKESIKSKINTKAFKGINIFLCILLIVIINLDSIIRIFGGDFKKLVNVYIVNECEEIDFEGQLTTNTFSVLDNYNAKIKSTNKTLDELKKDIIKDETKDIIIHITPSKNESLESIFDAEIISYKYVDKLLYQELITSLNNIKRNIALNKANIDSELLSSVYKEINIKRTLLDKDLNENEEMLELIGAIITIIFILPIFMLIITVVQMLGAEINEEKSSRGMEVIISSVSPKVHFLSKLVSSNLFALLQSGLIILYGLIGIIIRFLTTGTVNINGLINNVIAKGDAPITTGELFNMLAQSDMLAKLVRGLPFIIILIILTFIAYTLFIGILASVTTSMEDFNQIQTPVMVFLMAGYFLAIYASIFQGSTFLNIMSHIPFISGILSPVMYALGEVNLSNVILSIFILLITNFVLYKYGLRVYKVGILNYSSSNLWNKIFKALKNKD